jgi:hypothetical protein
VRLTILSILAFVMITVTTGGCCTCRGKRPKKDDDESTASISVRPAK